MYLLLGENLGEIRGSIPARFWPPGLLLPGENLGKIRGRIAPRFWPPGISFPGENLAEIPARFPPGRKIPAAKISPGSRRDSRRDRGSQDPDSYFTRVCTCLMYFLLYAVWSFKVCTMKPKNCSDYSLYSWLMIHPVVLVVQQIQFMLKSNTIGPFHLCFSCMHHNYNIHVLKCQCELI